MTKESKPVDIMAELRELEKSRAKGVYADVDVYDSQSLTLSPYRTPEELTEAIYAKLERIDQICKSMKGKGAYKI